MSISPHLVVSDAADAIAFYTAAFEAVETFRMVDPTDGRIGHAELAIRDSVVMLADEYPDFGAVSPDTLGGSPVILHLSTNSVDGDVDRAARAGATVLRPPTDQSYGERSAMLLDPFGHRWTLSQKIEEVDAEEMQKRWNAETGA